MTGWTAGSGSRRAYARYLRVLVLVIVVALGGRLAQRIHDQHASLHAVRLRLPVVVLTDHVPAEPMPAPARPASGAAAATSARVSPAGAPLDQSPARQTLVRLGRPWARLAEPFDVARCPLLTVEPQLVVVRIDQDPVQRWVAPAAAMPPEVPATDAAALPLIPTALMGTSGATPARALHDAVAAELPSLVLVATASAPVAAAIREALASAPVSLARPDLAPVASLGLDTWQTVLGQHGCEIAARFRSAEPHDPNLGVVIVDLQAPPHRARSMPGKPTM